MLFFFTNVDVISLMFFGLLLGLIFKMLDEIGISFGFQ